MASKRPAKGSKAKGAKRLPLPSKGKKRAKRALPKKAGSVKKKSRRLLAREAEEKESLRLKALRAKRKAARLEEARLEEERLARAARRRSKARQAKKELERLALEEARLRRSEAAKRGAASRKAKAEAKALAKKRKSDSALRKKVCEDLIAKPTTDLAMVFGSGCYGGKFYEVAEENWGEGELRLPAGQDSEEALQTLQDYTEKAFAANPDAWVQIAMYGTPPPDIDLDDYDKHNSRYGIALHWRRADRAAYLFLAAEKVSVNLMNAGFANLHFFVRVYTGDDNPGKREE